MAKLHHEAKTNPREADRQTNKIPDPWKCARAGSRFLWHLQQAAGLRVLVVNVTFGRLPGLRVMQTSALLSLCHVKVAQVCSSFKITLFILFSMCLDPVQPAFGFCLSCVRIHRQGRLYLEAPKFWLWAEDSVLTHSD